MISVCFLLGDEYLDTIFKVPLSGGGLFLLVPFPRALSTEFRVHWRGGRARSAQTGLRWGPDPMNSFFILPRRPRDSQESSPTPQFKSNNSLVLSFLYGPALSSIHHY